MKINRVNEAEIALAEATKFELNDPQLLSEIKEVQQSRNKKL
jgi:hypothetical protein